MFALFGHLIQILFNFPLIIVALNYDQCRDLYSTLDIEKVGVVSNATGNYTVHIGPRYKVTIT